MPWVAFRNISDSDLSCMLTALKSLPPVKHQVLNSLESTYCEVCGRWHGYGKYNRIAPLIQYPGGNGNYSAYAGSFINKYGDTTHIRLKDKKLWVNTNTGDSELIRVTESQFQASGYPGPVSFIKDRKGRVHALLVHDLFTDTSIRLQ